MVVTVTSIRLRRLWDFFRLTYLASKIVKQTRTQKGFVRMRNTGFGYLHYTLSVWESEEDVKDFARSGAHLEAMKASRSLSHEIRTYTFQTDRAPSWKEAKKLLLQNGRALSFE